MEPEERTTTLPVVAQREADDPSEDDAAEPVRRRRRPLVFTAVGVVLVATIGGIGYTWLRASDAGPAPAGPARAGTAKVGRGDLSQHKVVSGTLGFGAERGVKGRRAGTVTWLPAAGDTVSRGSQLARIDDRPVTVFYGKMPLYRTLGAPPAESADDSSRTAGSGTASTGQGSDPAEGQGKTGGPESAKGTKGSGKTASAGGARDEVAGPGTTGADVKLLEENLYALGYRDFGRPDSTLTDQTVTAIKRWQKNSLKIAEPTGRISPSDVEVLTGRARIGQVKAHLGDPAEGDLVTLTGTSRTVTVPLAVSDLSLAAKGTKVSVSMPDASTATGKVASVGKAVTASTGTKEGVSGGQEAKINVTVTLDDASAGKGLEGAPVSVSLTSQEHKGVLTVPVGALVALREGGYALQLPAPAGGKDAPGDQTRLVAVKTGMFAQGLVEVSGADVKEGMKVVTTQ
ncbi:peptidoglycan-binding protein [Streptomyces sp. NPDC001941]|uniref:peptidoglycan-binding protein n=1 Tax=Streptomyces sp. NPDC001941 TaxID=3154659 RepID=UPI0033270B4F